MTSHRRDFVTNRESENKCYTVFISYQAMSAKNNFPIFESKITFSCHVNGRLNFNCDIALVKNKQRMEKKYIYKTVCKSVSFYNEVKLIS